MNWWRTLDAKIKLNEPLKDKTTFKIGGAARFFSEPKDISDLKSLIILAKKHKIPIFILGAGSNILVSDKGVNGLVIKLNPPYFKKISFQNSICKAGGAVLLRQLIEKTKEKALSGIEFLAGVPGTVGGALVMNAGGWGKNIRDLVENVTIMDYNGNIKTLKKEEIQFGYRVSGLSKYIVLSAAFRLFKKTRKEIQDNINLYLKYRRDTQDLSKPSAGCIFKNPAVASAGRLIDLCGLKGKRLDGAGISSKHANFIVNLDNAKASCVLKLMSLIKKKIKDRFNIKLEPEIKIWE
jgi:UDP-N-acetylmuramate dehydrogenase